ncbi:MAG: MTH938/NDUFAF3 family protein [Chloroflexota bacterium]|jgi:hypothetical protein
MDARLISFGLIEVDGQRFEHDIVIEQGRIRKRKKGPSKTYREDFGHTPLSAHEAIPWSAPTLIVGTGVSGQLPIMPEVREEAERRDVTIIAEPTAEACDRFRRADPRTVSAILHVTC